MRKDIQWDKNIISWYIKLIWNNKKDIKRNNLIIIFLIIIIFFINEIIIKEIEIDYLIIKLNNLFIIINW